MRHTRTAAFHTLGCKLNFAETSTLSRSLDTADDARALGASEHLATGDAEAMKAARGRFDLIINTVSANLDMEAYLRLLSPFGALVNVGLPDEPYSVRPFAVIGGNKVLTGSQIGGIAETQEMLDFCAKHGITSDIEMIRADEIETAYERMLKGDVKYRFVMDIATM